MSGSRNTHAETDNTGAHSADDHQRLLTAKKAFQSMWIAGTTGAFFTALGRNLPTHVHQLIGADFPSVLDLILRYGYLLWLLAYLFTSNLRNSPNSDPKPREVPFDILQSACGLAAAYGLGFIMPDHGFGTNSYGWAMGLANATIFMISLFSLIWFHSFKPTEINRNRVIGMVVSSLGILLALAKLPRTPSLLGFLVLQFGLWGTLYSFIRKRLKAQPSELVALS